MVAHYHFPHDYDHYHFLQCFFYHYHIIIIITIIGSIIIWQGNIINMLFRREILSKRLLFSFVVMVSWLDQIPHRFCAISNTY